LERLIITGPETGHKRFERFPGSCFSRRFGKCDETAPALRKGSSLNVTLLSGLLRFLSLLWCSHPPRKRTEGVGMHQQREGEGPSAMISTSAVRLLHEYTGRGPTKAKTVINEDLVTILLADTLTKGERTLVENGRSDQVIELRHEYQLVMREDLVAIVERQLDRKVIAFMSQNHIDPDLAVEVFVLEPGDGGSRPAAF